MKPFLTLIALLAALLQARAQISVEVQFDQDQFLPAETLIAKVRISNFSGQTLTFGETPDWLVFNIGSPDGLMVEKTSQPPVIGKFSLASSSIATKRVNLAPHFNLTRLGRYVVSATVKIAQWDREWSGKGSGFSIMKGVKIWEQDFGVPRAGGEPELRKYSLLQARYLKQMTLYARVTDLPENRIFKVEAIGPMVSFSKPEGQVDAVSHLHVLWQVGPHSFKYVALNPDGETTVRQMWDYGEVRPALRANEEGRVLVIGGVRRETEDDVPVPEAPKEDLPRPVAQP